MSGLVFSGLGDLATWVSVAFTLVAGAAAAGAFVHLRRRERRQALTDLHVSLTTAETARARNTIGALLYGDQSSSPSKAESIEAYFALIWALQRARNVFRTYGFHWRELNQPQRRLSALISPRKRDASLALTWNLTEIAENVVRFRDLYQRAWAIEDADAWADVGTYISAEQVRRLVGQ